MLECQYKEGLDEGKCVCKQKTSYIEGKGCIFNGELHGLCNGDIECYSTGTECNTKTGNGTCVCKRYHT